MFATWIEITQKTSGSVSMQNNSLCSWDKKAVKGFLKQQSCSDLCGSK